jgi:hypothetical protein
MNETPPDDLLARRISTLSAPALPPALSARVRAQSRAAFVEAGRPRARFGGLLTGAAVGSAIFVYLTWAVEFLAALARG